MFRLLREHARAAGLEQPRGGAVAVIQRFGGALNLNVHIHTWTSSVPNYQAKAEDVLNGMKGVKVPVAPRPEPVAK